VTRGSSDTGLKLFVRRHCREGSRIDLMGKPPGTHGTVDQLTARWHSNLARDLP
jgi:hypothetical protein